MPFKIVRNDITKMQVDAIVNPSNPEPVVGTGCETAIYETAGRDTLLEERRHFGSVAEGEVFLTGGYGLPAAHVIHAVSPRFWGGGRGEEERLRSCYRKSLELAAKQGFHSIAFPLLATGGYGYPREEAMGIAAEEIRAFLDRHEMMVYLTVFDEASSALGGKIYPDLEAYIDRHYVEEKLRSEYVGTDFMAGAAARGSETVFGTAVLQSAQAPGNAVPMRPVDEGRDAAPKQASRNAVPMNVSSPELMAAMTTVKPRDELEPGEEKAPGLLRRLLTREKKTSRSAPGAEKPGADQGSKRREAPMNKAARFSEAATNEAARFSEAATNEAAEFLCDDLEMESHEKAPQSSGKAESCDEVSADWDFEKHESALNERMTHLSDTYQQYLFYLIENKGMTNAEVYKRAIVDKKVFAKIKANPEYHPKKMTALCLCVGAKLNLDETKDLLARAGYALSPCDKTDVIFSYFIEHGIYDMIEIDIQLEEHGLPCIIA
ncbi:MAG: macro domain-containing protein [Lachnospiraceae bacterium]|nr:macro domain-containing protein [Lachnospiraceae bacterium]